MHSYNKNDFIGQKYKVYDVLGKGGFGIVYLVYDYKAKDVFALKTFRDEHLTDSGIRDRFQKEAQIWVTLEKHPYIVRAHFVEEIEGRLYIAMEYIAPDDFGLNTLQAYFDRRPPDLKQSLHWAIQFCHGMEHAYLKGIRAHRDIKPANIMITQEKIIKISDFGLSGIISSFESKRDDSSDGKMPLMQTARGSVIGTPTHMPPEQFEGIVNCDERSDIYSFGVVLFQLASGGKLPFYSDNYSFQIFRHLHNTATIPKLNSPLFPMIQRCMEKDQSRRYEYFSKLRSDLEQCLKQMTGETIRKPQTPEFESWEWNNKGSSLKNLGLLDEAIVCFNKAIEINPSSVVAWHNKGVTLTMQELYLKAINCYNEALKIDKNHASSLSGKAGLLLEQEKYDEAIHYFDLALRVDSDQKDTWANKGLTLSKTGKWSEAIYCYKKCLEIDPEHAYAWYNMGLCLGSLNKLDEEIECLNKAVKYNPDNSLAWFIKAHAEEIIGRIEDAFNSYKFFCKTTSDNDRIEFSKRRLEELKKKLSINSLINKGEEYYTVGQYAEAIDCFDKVLDINSNEAYVLYKKGTCYYLLKFYKEAIECFNKAIESGPQLAPVWYNKALCEDEIGEANDAIISFSKVIELSGNLQNDKVIYSFKRLKELKNYNHT